MKIIKSTLILLLSLLITSCSFGGYDFSKDLDEMNSVELKEYNEYLKEQNSKLENKYDKLLDTNGGKSDYEILEMINYINNEVIKSNVMITNESKLFFHTTSVSSGSGTIIKENDDYYYVLTNNHVIYSLGNRTSYFIYDYLNNEYSATLLFNDPNYDMALLRFNKGNVNLRVSKLSDSDPLINENVIAIGQPLGQRNAITFGEVVKYDEIKCSNCAVDESNINYACVYYDAITSNGNSGGMLINYNYELVGVVTYGLTDIYGNYIYGAGSPVSKVKEFFAKNSFEVGDEYE